MKLKFSTLFLLFLLSFPVFAQEQVMTTEITSEKSTADMLQYKKTLGHNMSGNSYTLNSGDCVLSPYLSACGVTDNFMVGTSTWMYWDYNTHSLAARYSHKIDSENTLGVQSVYMKSFNTDTEYYQMENIRTQFILSRKIDKYMTHHYNLTYEYFYDETVPHSFRRDPLNDDAYQVSISNLFEVDYTDKYILQYEIGVHGINYFYPQILTGFSFGRRWKNAYFQFGFSANGTPRAFANLSRSDSNRKVERNSDLLRNDFAIHPELQYQYYF
ncbi:MAG: hypothetical protein CME62_15095 [Halobacteriovoraceae bacterium]|nr:hypothetical protein [Halobacteriovoraceae bacterium]|tara:strand:- start:19522 stop:20334 length:813 start_codon:yes stop_codon:yes gene_type:complete